MKKFLLLAALSLAGCDATITTEVKLSDLTGTGDLTGDLHLQITSCNDYKDSRNPSSSLLEAKDTVARIFKGSAFVSCFKKRFESFAQFSIPIAVDRVKDGKLASNSKINIVTNEKMLLGVGMSKEMADRISRMRGADKVDMSFEIGLTNDTAKAAVINVQGAYVDGAPSTYLQWTFQPGNRAVIRLGDVATSVVMGGTITRVAEVGIAQ